MDKRINLELRGQHPSEAKELDLSGCKNVVEFEGLTEEFTSLEVLDVSNSNIASLEGFPKLPNLRRIDLSKTRICKNFEPLLVCTNLQHISLNGNRIKDFSVFEPLKSLVHLTHLEFGLEECRPKIFEVLPHLQFVDGDDIDGNAEEDETQMNGTMGTEAEDDEDGDDELDIEEEEEDSEEDSDEGEEEVGSGLDTLYTSVNREEDEEDEDNFNGSDASDEDEGDEENREPTESTRGKVTESTRGKKRRFDEEGEGGV